MSDACLPITLAVPYAYEPGRLALLDQRRLPWERTWIACRTAEDVAAAIRSLAVRGAPLIGVAAAFGVALEARRIEATEEGDLAAAFALLGAARPTAVNLPAALVRMRNRAGMPHADSLVAALEDEASRIAEEDRLACLAIGRHGADLLEAIWGEGRSPVTLLTHCNAGALATAGIGTALGVVRVLATRRSVAVFADETRPFFQGSRLTAWELMEDGIDVTLLPDVAAASVIASGRVDAAVVGADRIAANGDTANKVGTYGVALACREAGIPFLVAAPTTTVDLAATDGAAIPIELRSGEEVLFVEGAATGVRIAPDGAAALYPAFDVTPARMITAIVTERGVAKEPFGPALAALAGGRGS